MTIPRSPILYAGCKCDPRQLWYGHDQDIASIHRVALQLSLNSNRPLVLPTFVGEKCMLYKIEGQEPPTRNQT